jgi:hypothetical protein
MFSTWTLKGLHLTNKLCSMLAWGNNRSFYFLERKNFHLVQISSILKLHYNIYGNRVGFQMQLNFHPLGDIQNLSNYGNENFTPNGWIRGPVFEFWLAGLKCLRKKRSLFIGRPWLYLRSWRLNSPIKPYCNYFLSWIWIKFKSNLTWLGKMIFLF